MKKEALLGLSKLLKKQGEQIRDDVLPGDHKIDETFMLHVFGTLKVGCDHEYVPTVSIPHKAVLALFVQHCGITREVALAKLEQAMVEALKHQDEEDGPKAAELLAAMADLDEAEARVQETLEELPKAVRKGNVSVAKLDCIEIKAAPKKAGKGRQKAA